VKKRRRTSNSIELAIELSRWKFRSLSSEPDEIEGDLEHARMLADFDDAQATRYEQWRDLHHELIDRGRHHDRLAERHHRRSAEADYRVTKSRGRPWRVWRRGIAQEEPYKDEPYFELVCEITDKRAASALRTGKRPLSEFVPGASCDASIDWLPPDPPGSGRADKLLTRFATAYLRLCGGTLSHEDFARVLAEIQREQTARELVNRCAAPGCNAEIKARSKYCSGTCRKRAFDQRLRA